MRRMTAAVLAFAFAIHTAPTVAYAAAQGSATLTGTAQNSGGQALGNYTVQLRNVETGQLVGSTTSNAVGSFAFSGLGPANYVVEIVNAAGQVVGTSAVTAVTAGATVTLAVTTAAATALTAGGISTLVLLTTLAAGGGLAAFVVSANQEEASPTR